MDKTKIRWADATWNPATGCTKVSPGCDHCYAELIAEKRRGTTAFPNGFDPTWKPHKLREPLARQQPTRYFVNSMSDLFHPDFGDDQIGDAFAVMAHADRHQYLILTKRPKRMLRFVESWLDAHDLEEVPPHIWLGTSIESDTYVWRADWLRRIPVPIRFLSLEPLLGPLPSLDLTGIAWVIVGGESGPGYRPMDDDWARDLLARSRKAGAAYFFKQHAAPRTEMGMDLDGVRYDEWPHYDPATGRVQIVTA